MPTYDYRCNACDHEWEEFQPMGSKAIRLCPGCGARKAERQIGAGAGIIFKGSGFYQTDYRSDSYQRDAKADTKPKPADSKDSSASDKSESKPKSTSKKTAAKKND